MSKTETSIAKPRPYLRDQILLYLIKFMSKTTRILRSTDLGPLQKELSYRVVNNIVEVCDGSARGG